jgi:hypothetical protein
LGRGPERAATGGGGGGGGGGAAAGGGRAHFSRSRSIRPCTELSFSNLGAFTPKEYWETWWSVIALCCWAAIAAKIPAPLWTRRSAARREMVGRRARSDAANA